MKTKTAFHNTGYALGCGSLLAALVYFFASNWGALDRWQKLTPLVLLVIALYGLYVYLANRPHRQFLSRLSLLSVNVAFGVSLAVVGQTYNSHADSYTLFLIWFVAAVAFAIAVRWQPFYVLAYVLGHLAYWLAFFPTIGSRDYADGLVILIVSALALLNGMIYVLSASKRLQSPVIAFLSYTVGMGIVILLSNSLAFEAYYVWFNIVFIGATVFLIRRFIRSVNQLYLLWTGLLVSIFIVMKYVELLFHFEAAEAFFVTGLIFVGLFIWGGARWVQYVRSLAAPEDASDKAERSGAPTRDMIIRALTVTVIAVGTLIGTVTLIGFILLVTEFDHPEYVLSGIGLMATLVMTAARTLNPVVRYTLLAIGLCIGVGTALVADQAGLLPVYIAATAIAFYSGKSFAERAVWFTATVVIAGLGLGQQLEDVKLTLTILTVVLPVLAWLHRFIRNPELGRALKMCGYYAFLLVFFALTFAGEHYAYDGLYALTLIACIAFAHRADESAAYRFTLVLSGLFVAWKYYDTSWKLLHKSWSLALIGFVLIAATYIAERRTLTAERAEKPAAGRSRLRFLGITAVVVAQLLVLSVQIGRSETILASGQTIYLELLPLDPRSLLQGDYVELRYTVSAPPASFTGNEPRIGSKLRAVIDRKQGGVYEFKRLYEEGTALQPGEAVLNGKWNGYRIEYGIESFFVPEGTGIETQLKAKYAEIRLASSGNALIVALHETAP